MIDYINQDLFLGSSVHKELRITTDDGAVTITNEDLHQEKFELRESLCSEPSLVFGSCEASSIKYTVSNIFGSLKGKWLNLSMILNHDETNPFSIGRYKVDSDVPTANRDHREVVAYDALHDVITAEVSKWYNTVLPNEDSTVTLKAFRDSFFAHFGIEQENVALPNDAMVVTKTIRPEELSGKTVIVAICEINGCFGNIGRNGKFRYVFLEQNIEGLYPSQTLFPSDTLFPQEPKTTLISNGTYIPPCKYESYNVQSLSGVLIRKEENDVGAQIGTEDNLYIIQDNFLVYGKSEEELVDIANNIFGRIRDIKYRPFNTKAKGNPCLEVGDAIRLSTKTDRIESYILTRTLTGIQALVDDYTADGTEKQGNSVNTIRHAIIELKNKSNVLTRTVDETRSEITDLDKDLRSTISQTAGKLSVDIENLKTETNTNLTVIDGKISAEVTRAQDAESSLQISINGLSSTVSNLSDNTQSQIIQLSSSISSKVSKGSVISEINQSAEQVTIDAEKINLRGYVSAGGGNFTIDESGNLKIVNNYHTVELGNNGMEVTGDSGQQIIYGGTAIWFRNNNTTYGRIELNGSDINVNIPGNYGGRFTFNGSQILTNNNFSLDFNSSSTNISYTSVGNINIASANGYQAESEYKYGNIASTGWVQGKVKSLNETISNLSDSIAAIDMRLAALEAKVV